MSSTTVATLLTTSISTGWDYISALFSTTLGAVLGFIAIGGIFSLVVYGVGRLFRHK